MCHFEAQGCAQLHRVFVIFVAESLRQSLLTIGYALHLDQKVIVQFEEHRAMCINDNQNLVFSVPHHVDWDANPADHLANCDSNLRTIQTAANLERIASDRTDSVRS